MPMHRLVLPFAQMEEAAPYMAPERFRYVKEDQSESFEGFEDYDLLAFDWYDIRQKTEAAKILLYFTKSSSPPSSTSWRTTTTSCSLAPFANGS